MRNTGKLQLLIEGQVEGKRVIVERRYFGHTQWTGLQTVVENACEEGYV